MQLPQLLIHYKLDSLQLIKILISNEIYVDLRLIKHVPDNWLPILTEATGIEIPIFGDKPKREIVAINPPVLEPSSEEFKSNKLSLDDLDKLLLDEPVTITKVTEHAFGKREIVIDQTSRKHQKGRGGKLTHEKEFFWAYVKFVAADRSHGYLKRLNTFKKISYFDLKSQDDLDYIFNLGDFDITKDQLVICSSTSRNDVRKRANIESITFNGINGDSKVTVLSGLVPNTDFENIKAATPIPATGFFADFTLQFTRDNRFFVNYLPPSEDTKSKNGIIALDQFKQSLLKLSFTNEDIGQIKNLATKVTDRDELHKSYKEAFDYQRAENSKQLDQSEISTFIKNWLKLSPDLVTIESLNFPLSTSFYLELWFSGILPVNFWGEKLQEVFYTYFSENPELEISHVFNKFRKVLINHPEKIFDRLLQNYFHSIETVESTEFFSTLHDLAKSASETAVEEFENTVIAKLSAKVKLELWLEGKLNDFPLSEAVEFFGLCSAKDKDRIVDQLSDSELLEVVNDITPEAATNTKNRCSKLLEENLFKSVNAIALDIESDGTQINELAWGNDRNWFTDTTPEGIKDLQTTLQNRINESNPLIIGHNITDFDCPVLETKDLIFDLNQVWDTLLVELILSPGLKTYALKTSHKAIDDAELGFKLFKNQVLRIIKTDEVTWNLLSTIISPKTQQILQPFRSGNSLAWLTEAELKEEVLHFLRPQPQRSSLLNELADKLDSSAAKVKVVLASSDFWDELAVIPRLSFFTANKSDNRFWEINEEVFLNQLDSFPYECAVAKKSYPRVLFRIKHESSC